MLDYDREAAHYDETRGGRARADAAAAAIRSLLPEARRRRLTLVDVAGGTGSVAASLRADEITAIVVDLSHGMLRHAVRRLPGRAVHGSGLTLPFAGGSVDVTTCIWLLHLMGDRATTARVIAECARVLRRGGRLLTTVDKDAASGYVRRTGVTDARSDVIDAARLHGLDLVGESTFVGRGQGRAGVDPVYPLVAFTKEGR